MTATSSNNTAGSIYLIGAKTMLTFLIVYFTLYFAYKAIRKLVSLYVGFIMDQRSKYLAEINT